MLENSKDLEESKQRVFLISQMRKTIREDHNDRGADRFSESAFQKDLLAAYPKVETSVLLATSRIYANALTEDPTLNRGINEDKLEGLVNFIFVNNGHLPWPRTRQLVRTFADGKFKHLLKGEETSRTPLTEDALIRAGATPGKSKLVQLFEVQLLEMKDKEQEMSDEIGKALQDLEEALRNKNELKGVLKGLLDLLEDKKDLLTTSEKEKIEKLKRILK